MSEVTFIFYFIKINLKIKFIVADDEKMMDFTPETSFFEWNLTKK